MLLKDTLLKSTKPGDLIWPSADARKSRFGSGGNYQCKFGTEFKFIPDHDIFPAVVLKHDNIDTYILTCKGKHTIMTYECKISTPR